MDWGPRLVAGIVGFALVFHVGFSPVSGFGGDGNSTFQPAPDCNFPAGIDNACFGDPAVDDNNYDGADTNDAACVTPIEPCVDNKVLDRTEGNIWDSDMSTTLGEEGAESDVYESEGVMFSGSVYRGPRINDNTMENADTGSLTEHYIDEARPELSDPDDSDWAFGNDEQYSFVDSEFPAGTEWENSRAVYPPNPMADQTERCGDGRENDPEPQGDDATLGFESPDSDIDESTNSDDEETSCRDDYGQIHEKFDIREAYQKDGISCNDDDATADAECTGDSKSCGSCTSDSCSCDGQVDTDRCYQDDTETHYIFDSDKIGKETCTDDGGTVDSDTATKDVCSSDGDCGCSTCTGPYGGSYPCNCDTSYTHNDQDYTCDRGDDRSWDDNGQQVNCNDHNTVDGGSSDGSSNSENTEHDRNDEAATYTEFTAYGDANWDSGTGGSELYDSCSGSNDGETSGHSPASDQTATGRAWCAFEYTVTVDADGPKGYGDGFVVIENRGSDGKYSGSTSDASIVATEAHNGDDVVGDRIRVATREAGDGSASGGFMSARDKMTSNSNIMSCPDNKEVCIKYVDYWTIDSGWTATSAGNNYKDAVRVDQRHALTPDRSYSVCKNINRIARQNGNADGDLVRCDYVKEDASSPGGVERISPLPEACGDDINERLIASEGREVDEDAIENYLAFHQECFQYPGDPDDVDNTAVDGADPSSYGNPGPDTTDSSYLEVEWIDRVDFKDISHGSSVDTDDGYQDFTNKETALRKGESQRLQLTFGVDSGSYPEKGKVWIDFDGDGNLDTSDEEFVVDMEGDNSISGGETYSADITVPSTNDVELGYTLMRVAIRNGDQPEPNAVSGWNYGETEDYSVELRETAAAEENITTGACVLRGKVYPEGTVKNVADTPQQRSKFTGFEEGGDSHDKEVCLNIDNSSSENGGGGNEGSEVDDLLAWKYPGDRDKGGEWWDVDNWRATEYVRNHDLDSKDYEELWMDNPDDNASTDVHSAKSDITGVEPEYTSEGGFALEDDCAATINNERIDCEDMDSGTGRITPVFARFTEGTRDEDYNFVDSWFDVNLPNYHNRVQNGGKTGHEDDGDPLSESTMAVETESDWNEGSFYDTEASGTFLNTTEEVGSADREGVVMSGINVFGWYESKVFDKTPETVFTNIRALNEFSGGDHPLVVEFASDQSFTQDTSSQEFLLTDQSQSENFTLTASPDQQYMRFKVGIGEEEVPSQVAFVVDETGSMGSVQDQIQTRAKDFIDSLGAGSEGAVIGINNDANWRSHGTAHIYQSFTTNTQDVKDAIDALAASGGEEATGKGVQVGVQELDWNSGFSKAMIYVQEGNGCTCNIDPSDYTNNLNNQDITFYNVESGSEWHTELVQMTQDTDGRHWDSPGDWDEILAEIESDLTKLPDEPIVDRVEIKAVTPSTTGFGNKQDEEPLTLKVRGHPDYLDWYDNAEIDSQDDEWAYTPEMDWGIANNGTAWPPGQCWGAPREQGVDKHKEDATYANSYLRGRNVVRDTQLFSEPKEDGNWINPDIETQSVIEGGVTCDLTGHDWGYAVENDTYSGIDCLEGDCDDTGNPSSSGTEGVESSIPHEIVVDTNDFTWDMDTNPGSKDQNDLDQWKKACGDDRHEYLIREHASKLNGEYNPTFSGRDDYYACADRPTDCVLDGEVYSEGQIVDVSDITQETGVQSEDQEICLDRDDELPGGEWYDVDNQDIRDTIIGTGIVEDTEVFVREGEIESDKPYKIFWHNASTQDAVRDAALTEARDSPYSPLGGNGIYGTGITYWRGYALEDDCDTDVMSGCDDKGVQETLGTHSDTTSDLIYSPFRNAKNGEAIKSDDYSTEETWVVRMYVDGSSIHGSDTGQMNENTNGVNFDSTTWGWPTSGLNDSNIDSDEDTWAVASQPYDAVGPTGEVYDTGQCHGKNPPQHSEGWIEKNETVMSNSFAKREDVNSARDKDEGHWVDPDTTERTVSRGGLSCDLNNTDWGIGYDLGSGSSLNIYEGDARSEGYEVQDRHAVSGPITFDMSSDPLGGNQDNLQQYPDACGDDKNEYLVREQRTFRGNEIDPNENNRDNIYVCADRITDCAYNGKVYSEGQVVDISAESPSFTDPENGENIKDEEVCLDLDKTTPGGEWYDKDQDLTVQNRIVGLEDTFDVSEGTNGYGDTFTLEGRVVDDGGGYLDINGRVVTVSSDGSFSDSINLVRDTEQRIDYIKAGETLAQKRIYLPDEASAELNDIVISTNLAYDGWQVWDGMERFKDDDFDRNNIDPKYNSTDWKNQGERYDRTELGYFNNQGMDLSPPTSTENVRNNYTKYYNPEGYATEDDCGPLLSKSSTGPCGDVGGATQDFQWFSAGNFSREGVP